MELSIYENPSLYFEEKAADAGVSINLLCDEAGLARSTFTRWKSNSFDPTFTSIKKLEKALKKLSAKTKRRSSNNNSNQPVNPNRV